MLIFFYALLLKTMRIHVAEFAKRDACGLELVSLVYYVFMFRLCLSQLKVSVHTYTKEKENITFLFIYSTVYFHVRLRPIVK